MAVVSVKTYPLVEWDEGEIRRYAGLKQSTPELEDCLAECKREVQNALSYKVCYKEFPISISGDEVDLAFKRVCSRDLAKNLAGCKSVVVFACTVGVEMDRLINRAVALSPAKGLIMHAIGVERVESLANTFNNELKAVVRCTKPRFSPGYGDLDISLQRDILDELMASKHIGVTLGTNLMMSPSKSVTAIVGVCDSDMIECEQGCSACKQANCEFRRQNEHN